MIKSSTGGNIQFTSRGLIHTPAKGAYSGRLAEEGIEAKVVDAPKRGRGRPPKVSQSGVAYDFSAFPAVKVPKWKGPTLVVKAKVE